MGRSTWLAAGVALGIGGTLWAEQRVRRTVAQAVDRLTPEHLANDALSSVKAAGNRMRSAVDLARDERGRKEGELWAEYEARRSGDVAPGAAEFTVTHTHVAPVGPGSSGPGRAPKATGSRRVGGLRSRRLSQ